MNSFRIVVFSAAAALGLGWVNVASAADYDQSFLPDYSKFVTTQLPSGGMKTFASRLRCRLDNAHVPKDKRIDCLDLAARAAREAAGPVVH